MELNEENEGFLFNICATIWEISRMGTINNNSVTAVSLRQAEHKLQSLHRVLSMYGTDEFGKYLKCRIQIPLARILFRPESLYCVNCAK